MKEQTRTQRKTKRQVRMRTGLTKVGTGEKYVRESEFETSVDESERRAVASNLAPIYARTVKLYVEYFEGMGRTAEDAKREASELFEGRKIAEGVFAPRVTEWRHIAALAEHDLDAAFGLWESIKREAFDEFYTGLRAARAADSDFGGTPFQMAEFLAIRDSFQSQWQSQGGIEDALIDMLSLSFSLYLYWTEIAHRRAVNTAEQMRDTQSPLRSERRGWKVPRFDEAMAIDQAHQLADGYNRQLLRILRQMRDLRRYTPSVIVNQPGGQVNVANQQMNVSRPE